MLTTLFFATIIASAVTDWFAVAKGWMKIETIAKPATMVFLFSYLAVTSGFEVLQLTLIGAGVLISLVGDIFLLISNSRSSERWFMLGLSSFLFAHVTYILGLAIPFENTPPMWGVLIGIVLFICAMLIMKKIIAGVRKKALPRMVGPVIVYGMVVTLMVLSAILTSLRGDWKITSSGLVILGAVLFFFSDIILAWNKFVNPVKNGRVINMLTYHLGQIALVVGAITQYGPSAGGGINIL